jgi:oxygen-independent coproporphyrinogen-3 oxidase
LNSIYIHIPFCNYKCDYCNFFVLQKSHPNFQDNLIHEYNLALHKEIDHRNDVLWKQEIKTIYLGWWTPLLLGKDNIFWLLDHIFSIRNCEYLEELNIELNPDPFDETLAFIEEIGKRYKDIHRLRFSFGIQTFDDEILEISWRAYNYNQLKHYLRNLQPIKQPNMCYNFDFIAFGSLSDNDIDKQWGNWWNTKKLAFFQDFVASQMADSFSLYMLELFPGSKRHQIKNWELKIKNDEAKKLPESWIFNFKSWILKQCINPDDNKVLFEYELLSDIIQSSWYRRYEVSNYALPGKESLHNMVYRTMQPYIGIWASASWCIRGYNLTDKVNSNDGQSEWITCRYTNTTILSDYFKWLYIDHTKTSVLWNTDILFEEFMLGMRSSWIQDIAKYESILIEQYQEKILLYEKEWLCAFSNWWLKLTTDGYNVANRIISELTV